MHHGAVEDQPHDRLTLEAAAIPALQVPLHPAPSATDGVLAHRPAKVLMGITNRLFLVIDAFSQFSGTPLACPADLSLWFAKQLLDSTATASG